MFDEEQNSSEAMSSRVSEPNWLDGGVAAILFDARSKSMVAGIEDVAFDAALGCVRAIRFAMKADAAEFGDAPDAGLDAALRGVALLLEISRAAKRTGESVHA